VSAGSPVHVSLEAVLSESEEQTFRAAAEETMYEALIAMSTMWSRDSSFDLQDVHDELKERYDDLLDHSYYLSQVALLALKGALESGALHVAAPVGNAELSEKYLRKTLRNVSLGIAAAMLQSMAMEDFTWLDNEQLAKMPPEIRKVEFVFGSVEKKGKADEQQ
jgi:hypothetical protein